MATYNVSLNFVKRNVKINELNSYIEKAKVARIAGFERPEFNINRNYEELAQVRSKRKG